MRRLFALLFVVGTACESTTQPSANDILVYGGDMGPLYENLGLYRSGNNDPVTGANVTVNGTKINETSNPGFYSSQLPSLLAPGAEVKLEVRSGSQTVKGTTNVPQVPVLVSPAAASMLTLGPPLQFTWTSSSNPDQFEMWLQYQVPAGGQAQRVTVPGSARSGSVPTVDVPANATTFTAVVFAYGNGTFTGPADATSRMHVRQESATVSLIKAP